MASSLPSIEGIAAGAKFNLCVGLQAGTLGASFLGALGVDAPNAANAYPSLFEWACDIPPADAPPPPQPPFIGGQCPVFYDLALLVTSDEGTSPGNGVPATAVGLGPLSIEQFSGPNSVGYRVRESGGGIVLSRSLNTPATNLGYQFTAVRQDGLPDNCGNPPFNPPIPPFPPTGAPVTGPITYVDEGGDTINIDGDFIFQAPNINIKGEVEVDFSVNISVDNRSYKGTLNLSTGGFTVSPTFVLPGRPNLTIDGPQVSPEPPSSDEPEDEDREANLIVAIVVTSDIANNRFSSEKFYSQQPTTTVPRLGVARFAVPVPGSSSVVWTADIPIKQSRQWIDCPCPYGAVDAIASPEPGSGVVILGVQFIRGKPPAALE